MKPEIILCISSFFSAWGDRMWNFAVGLYMIKLTPGSLQLAAIYGLTVTIAAVLFAPAIGDWVDRNARLKVVRITLVLQNLLVIVCALFILLYLKISTDSAVQKALQAVIILFGALANLAGQGEKIAVTKDWVVVVCDSESGMLATTNAWLRRIDLSVAILAPVAVGLLMTVISDMAGIIFICSWNVVSMFAEYGLLLHVYNSVVSLSMKVSKESESSESEPDGTPEKKALIKKKQSRNNLNFIRRLKSVLSGWSVYRKQKVFLAGMALAMLYLTVLGFNSITTGYAYSQGLSELYVSICFGLGSLVGIAGTFLFTLLRRKFGLVRTGLCGHILQLSMLMLCVASIWSPGSPSEILDVDTPTLNPTTSIPIFTTSMLATKASNSSVTTQQPNPPSTPASVVTLDKTSIILLMSGIILSRAGLWIIDLAVTQLQQETVPEVERGIVGGVQYSFNSVLDLTQFVLTIILPKPAQFGYLILISVSAVAVATLISALFYFTHHKELEIRIHPDYFQEDAEA